MRGIARKSAPIHVIVHSPTDKEGKQKLAEQVATVHADMVSRYIRKLNCPSEQKLQLLNAVIQSASEKKKEQ